MKQGGMRRETGGQITIFLSMVLMCVFACFCVLIESARTAGARWYLQTAADSALDSVFSQYHLQMWESYRLLFAEYELDEDLTADYANFLMPYLETENWYPMELETVTAEEVLRATEGDGLYLEQEILDYMKYGIWKLDFDASEVEGMWDGVKEAASVKDMAQNYRGHAKEALKLEKTLEAIQENLDAQTRKKQEGLSDLSAYDGPGFRGTARELIRELEKMPGLVHRYQKQADQLAAGLQSSREKWETGAGDCSAEMQQILEDEIREYETYVAADGERRQEIEALEGLSQEHIAIAEETIEEALEVEEIIEEWEEDEDDEDGEGDDGPDLEALWSPVRRHFDQIRISSLSFAHGVKDKKKEGWLNQVEEMYQSGLLSLVVPEGTVLSEKSARLDQVPSQTEMLFSGARQAGLADRLLIHEYCGQFFRNFRQSNGETEEEKERSGSGPEKTVLDYEVEYLLNGEASDQENLANTVTRLLAVREGLNLIHILSDSQKREEARNLAMVITGAASITPLILVTTFFVMSVWALGEAIMDIRGLLAGSKVMVVKAREDWTLSLEGLLQMGESRKAETGGSGRGLSYLSWLKILLFTNQTMEEEYRIMDLVQMNIRQEQKEFRMRDTVYQVKLTGKLYGKHVFFSLGAVEHLLGRSDYRYPMTVRAERVY